MVRLVIDSQYRDMAVNISLEMGKFQMRGLNSANAKPDILGFTTSLIVVTSIMAILETETLVCGKAWQSELSLILFSYALHCCRNGRSYRGMQSEHSAAVDDLRFWMRHVECPDERTPTQMDGARNG